MATAPPATTIHHAVFDCVEGLAKGQVFTIKGPITSVGRDVDCDINLQFDPSVSRNHATLEYIVDRFILKDLGSINGTKVNGTVVKGPIGLSEGDCVEIGESSFIFRMAPGPSLNTTLRAKQSRSHTNSRNNAKIAILGTLIAIAIYMVTMHFVQEKVEWDKLSPQEKAYKEWLRDPPLVDDRGIANPIVDNLKYNLRDYQSFDLIAKSEVKPSPGQELLWMQTIRFRTANATGGKDILENTYWLDKVAVRRIAPSDLFGAQMSKELPLGPPNGAR